MNAAQGGVAPRWRRLELIYWGLIPFAVAAGMYGFTLGGFFLSDDFHLLQTAKSAA
ncbi:MAG: hypothetical protein ACI9F9_000029, partial [Candidatus Paceibacteria bacterium]